MGRLSSIQVTREKHLDHMVKVVPFIVFFYGVHSYLLFNLNANSLSVKGLILLGGLMSFLITGLVFYDRKHRVELDEEYIYISFLGTERKISYQDVLKVEVISPQESFSTLKLSTRMGRFHFYFIDDAEKVKHWIIERQLKEEKKAA